MPGFEPRSSQYEADSISMCYRASVCFKDCTWSFLVETIGTYWKNFTKKCKYKDCWKAQKLLCKFNRLFNLELLEAHGLTSK